MSFLFDHDQLLIANEVERVLQNRPVGSRLHELLEEHGEFDREFWKTCIEQGWVGAIVPSQFGGMGLGLVEAGIILKACGQALSGAPFLSTSFGLSEALIRFGHASVNNLWLPKLATGAAIGAVAFSEAADVLPFAPEVRFVEGALVGKKSAVTAGAVADVGVVLAQAEGGLTLVLADLRTEAVERRVLQTFDNSRCAADLVFHGAPAIRLEVENASHAALVILSVQAVLTAHEQVGGAEAMLEQVRSYTLERRAFGQPIAAFQSVKHRLSEGYALVELARANAMHSAAQCANPDIVRVAATARLSANLAYETVIRDAIQLHGGFGVTWESSLHLHQRRARSLSIEHGASHFWQDQLVASLELGS